MAHDRREIVIWLILIGVSGLFYILSASLSPSKPLDELDESNVSSSTILYVSDSWLFHLIINLLGYSTVLVPGYLVIRYVRNSNYVDKSGNTCTNVLAKWCIFGGDGLLPTTDGSSHSTRSAKPELTFATETALLIFCFVGLQGSYLTWGIFQEKIMTQDYSDPEGHALKFQDSQFLVFVNRILAFVLSGTYIFLRRQPRHAAPLYKYSYCSFSNIMSAWCQYEALKYISFPTQVLAKASKIIPVMLMGKIVSKKKYEYYEYITAILITIGMAFFLLGSAHDDHGDKVTTISGVLILIGYMIFDSFTSNWQGELFTTYKMSSIQMMCGVNLFSCLLLAVSLLQQGSFQHSLAFMFSVPMFLFDCILLSICSATGQLFIYYTINQFGPVVFVIIMTIRQGAAIIISCILYHHTVTVTGIIGVLIVFVAIFLRIYASQKLKNKRKIPETTNVVKT